MIKTDGLEKDTVRTLSDLRASGLTAVEGTTADGRKVLTYQLTRPVPEAWAPRPIIPRAPGFYWVRDGKKVEIRQRYVGDEGDEEDGGWLEFGQNDYECDEPDEVLAGPLTPPTTPEAKP